MKRKTFQQRALSKPKRKPLPWEGIFIAACAAICLVSVASGITHGIDTRHEDGLKQMVTARDQIIGGYRSATDTHWATCLEDWTKLTVACGPKDRADSRIHILGLAPQAMQ